jgi:Rieske Fe-S protein
MSVEEELEPKSRRRFIHIVLGSGVVASIISFLYPAFRYMLPPRTAELGSDTVVAGNAKELKPNSGKIFKFGSKPGLLIRLRDGSYRAFAATCTHLNCTVQYRADMQRIWCACHNGMFDLNGRNVSGPPPRPLEQYNVHLRGEDIVVERKKAG